MHRDQALCVAQIILFFQVLECSVYPSIHWSPQNPLFDKNDSVMYVLPMSRVHVVCPNPTTVMKRVKGSASKDKLYQNLWIVSRESYERCNTDYTQGSRLLLRCNSPLELKYYTIVFHKYSAVSSQVYFPGREYYFIATSDGTRGSVYRRSGGNCQHAKMKLRISVCLNNKDPRCNTRTTAITTTTATLPTRTMATTKKATKGIPITFTTARSTTLSINGSSTTQQTTKLSTRTLIGRVRVPPSSLTHQSTSNAVTWTTATQNVFGRVGSGDQVISYDTSLMKAGLNWIIIIPLMACLLLSLLGNIILVCRLRFQQQEYQLQDKDHVGVVAASIKRVEPPATESRVEKKLLLFRRSTDGTDV